MEPSNSASNLPELYQTIGSAIIFVIVTTIAAIGWIKKHNPFSSKGEDKTPKDTVVLSAAIADSMAIQKLAMAIEANLGEQGRTTQAIEDLTKVAKGIYEEQERTNRLLKALLDG